MPVGWSKLDQKNELLADLDSTCVGAHLSWNQSSSWSSREVSRLSGFTRFQLWAGTCSLYLKNNSHATNLVFIIDLITNAEKLLYYHYERSTLTELGTRSPSFSPLWRRNVWQWSSFLTMARSSSSVLLWKKCNLAGIHWNRRRDQQLFGLIVVLWNTTGFYLRPCNKLHLYPHKWDIRNITGFY